ncbi:asparaginase [Paenibacillus sp.]|uniref:asparaginase n=1 Tax=Paenibacillus sp. TaxID=58172 RepID=UPI0028125BA5|nr:asparaginase [Paenibacillus sp.]
MTEALVQEFRGGMLENVHYGHICGVDETGRVRYAVGDPAYATFLRSAAKPIQALPFFLERLDEKLGFADEELAVMMASHRALPYHVTALDGMLQKLGLDEETLVCKPTYPLDASARDALVAGGTGPRRVYHNCSGKHLGVLAYCIATGLPTDGYERPEHPAQQRILRLAAELSGCRVEDIVIGTDGCGFPVFGMPLSAMANAFVRLACPDLIADADLRRAAERVGALMNANPDLISADYLICPNLLKDPNIVAKGGAKGIYCFGLRKERLAFALKVTDGSEEEWPSIVVSILEQIGYNNEETIRRLRRIGPKDIYNDNGVVIGENRSVFRLRTAEEEASCS